MDLGTDILDELDEIVTLLGELRGCGDSAKCSQRIHGREVSSLRGLTDGG